MRPTPAPVIALASFQRVLELARAACAGCECLALTVQYGLARSPEELTRMIEAVGLARAELDALEAWPAGALDGVRLQ